MGLAASQARLLTITARKADCEFESMKLSHQKIALARDMERISDEYQAAMNKTKLVYDYYGTGTSDMSLTYGMLMTPSVYNDYYPKLLTDRANRIVLSGAYADAARAAGIPAEGFNGTPSSEIRNKFIQALGNLGVVAPGTAATIQSLSYQNDIGLGATFSAAETTQDITYAQLKELIQASCIDTEDYGLSFEWNWVSQEALDAGNYNLYPDTRLLSRSDSSRAFRLVDNSWDDRKYNITLSDLLSNDHEYVIAMEAGNGSFVPYGEIAFIQQLVVGTEGSASFLNWMTDQFSAILGGVTENDLALQYAYNTVYDFLYPNENVQEMAAGLIQKDYRENTAGGAIEAGKWGCTKSIYDFSTETRSYSGGDLGAQTEDAKKYIGVTFGTDGFWGRRTCATIDLSTICDVFLTAFMEYQQGLDYSQYRYEKGLKNDAVLYEPKDDDVFKIKADADVSDGTENLSAGFYDALFNKICTNGWTLNENIENIEYMQELMKTGAIFISSMANDGMYYQNSYSTDTYISEVQDLEGIAQAEARYNAAKSKIENKENTIDVKMKNLDTEISSLTTEYDTMKGLINKTIEKSFKRYEA